MSGMAPNPKVNKQRGGKARLIYDMSQTLLTGCRESLRTTSSKPKTYFSEANVTKPTPEPNSNEWPYVTQAEQCPRNSKTLKALQVLLRAPTCNATPGNHTYRTHKQAQQKGKLKCEHVLNGIMRNERIRNSDVNMFVGELHLQISGIQAELGTHQNVGQGLIRAG